MSGVGARSVRRSARPAARPGRAWASGQRVRTHSDVCAGAVGRGQVRGCWRPAHGQIDGPRGLGAASRIGSSSASCLFLLLLVLGFMVGFHCVAHGVCDLSISSLCGYAFAMAALVAVSVDEVLRRCHCARLRRSWPCRVVVVGAPAPSQGSLAHGAGEVRTRSGACRRPPSSLTELWAGPSRVAGCARGPGRDSPGRRRQVLCVVR